MAKPKILLVDADLKSRQMLEISLKKAGFSITNVDEGEKAIQLLDTYHPDLIISDVDLAGTMDGYLFCEVLKERPEGRKIPFVFLTKRKEVEDKVRGLELGVDDYLTKPIYLKEVIARVRLILDKKRQEDFDPSGGEPLFQGDLSQMSIVDLLQTMEFGQKTGVLHLDKGERGAKLFVKQGRVVHAVCENLVGERAVYRTLVWSDGQFRIEFKKNLQIQETITVSTQALIMEGMRRIDELERIKEQLPPFDIRLTIDSETILEEHPDRFPAKIENILAEFNGLATLEEVVDALPYDDLESLEIIGKLYFQGFLIEIDEMAPPPPAPVEREAPTDSKLPPAASTLDTQMLNLDEASRSIEEIKAKARMAAGAAKAAAEPEKPEKAAPAPAEPAGEATVDMSPPAVQGDDAPGDETGFELAPPPDSADEVRPTAEAESPELDMAPPEDDVEPVQEQQPVPEPSARQETNTERAPGGEASKSPSKPESRPPQSVEVVEPSKPLTDPVVSSPPPAAPVPQADRPAASSQDVPGTYGGQPPSGEARQPVSTGGGAGAAGSEVRPAAGGELPIARIYSVGKVEEQEQPESVDAKADSEATPAGQAGAEPAQPRNESGQAPAADPVSPPPPATPPAQQVETQQAPPAAPQPPAQQMPPQPPVQSQITQQYPPQYQSPYGPPQQPGGPGMAPIGDYTIPGMPPGAQYPGMMPGQQTYTGSPTVLGDAPPDRKKWLIAGGIAGVMIIVLGLVFAFRGGGGGVSDSADPSDPYQVAERAFELVEQGQWASGIRLANQVLETNGDVPLALYARAKAQEQLGKISDAIVAYERALEISPTLYPARYDYLALQFAQNENPARLRQQLDDLLFRIDSDKDPALYRKVIFLGLKIDIAAKDWDRARKTLKSAQGVAPNDPQLAMLAGQIPEASSSPAPKPAPKPVAKAAPRPAAKPAPKPAAKPVQKPAPTPAPAPAAEPELSASEKANQLHEKGISFYRKGYLRNAKRTLEEATKLDANNDEIWVDLGRVLVELGEDREAMQVFTTAGKINPRNPRIWNNLGSLYMFQGDMDRAKKSFEAYLDLVPQDSQEAREIRKVLDNL